MTNDDSPAPVPSADDASKAAADVSKAAADLTAATKQLETSSTAAAASLTAAAKQIETSSSAAAVSLTEAAKQVEAAAEAAAAKLLAESTVTTLVPPELPPPSKLDEYVEDLIDPEFGAYSSRQVVRAAADKMLAGFNGLLWTRKPESRDE